MTMADADGNGEKDLLVGSDDFEVNKASHTGTYITRISLENKSTPTSFDVEQLLSSGAKITFK